MPIGLVAIDMYGTLVGPGGTGEMPAENRNALKDALDHGVKIALITGLNRGSALKVLEVPKIPEWPGLMIGCFNGAVMFELASGQIMWEDSHPPDLVARLVEHPAVAPHYPMVHGPFDFRNLFWIQKGNYPWIVARYLENRGRLLGSSSIRMVENLADSIAFPVQVVCALVPENTVHQTADQIAEQFADEVKIVKSRWGDGYAWLEILHPGTGKGEAVKRLCNHFGLSPSQVVAIGDNWNDIEMFQQAGLSIAMGNASDEVKQQATHVTLPWDQAGVAHAFHRWIKINYNSEKIL